MTEDPSFAEFLRRVRGGDEEAAAELVRRYEPMVRLEVRLRLRDRRLQRLFDSADVCQSVLASFFVRAASGQYDLDTPHDLVKLLVTMARNKLASEARRHHKQRRDVRRLEPGAEAELEEVSAGPTPSRVVASRELLARFREQLTEEERALADRRAQGRSWAEIAGELGGTPQARCKQLARAVSRVARQLGLAGDESEP
jgi:RNA polymerase sigma-70 factor (ECF subfamily)